MLDGSCFFLTLLRQFDVPFGSSVEELARLTAQGEQVGCVASSSWKLETDWGRGAKEIYQAAGAASLQVSVEINMSQKSLL